MQELNGKRVCVIGAGLGGISSALSLALDGFDVALYEKNDKIGGKLNELNANGYRFDLGPSILTLPHIFRRTFERAGRRMEDYVTIEPVRPHWRNFFEDGMIVDLHPDPEVMAREAEKAGEPAENVRLFLEYSASLFDLVNRGYFEQGLDTAADFRAFYGLAAFPKFDLLRSMHRSVKRHFETRYFIDIFDFFIKYVGSSAYRAPAFMNCMPTIQFRYDLWYVKGGLYGLARGLGRLLQELRVAVHLNSDVVEILRSDDGKRAVGIRLADGVVRHCDVVVSNMEVVPAHRHLLGEDASVVRKLEKRLEPACSGLVIDIGLNRQYKDLAHHNFIFSDNQKKHFHDVFINRILPEDPTLYVVAASRSDPEVAPEGCDCLKILPHIPYLDPNRPVTDKEYLALKERVLQKLERVCCPGLRQSIVFEHFWTPKDIEQQYRSNRGSIYGVVSDRFKNLAFKAPKRSSKYEGLYFVGGSVNPGGGMPMAFLSGQKAAELIAADLRKGKE